VSNVKWFLAVVAVALASAAVPIAQGTSDSVPTRLTAVEKKVTKLQRDMRTMQATVTLLRGCITAAPISAYGGLDTEGYLYRNTAENREFLTSALDITDQGDQPDAIMATLKPECVSQARAATSANATRASGSRAIPTLRLKAAAR
jgi:hypothetical protein